MKVRCALNPASPVRNLSLAALALVVAGAPGAAWGKPLSEVAEDHPGHHHAEFPNLVGLRVGYLSVVESPGGHAEILPGFLAGFSYERTLIHEWLELEASVPLAVIFGDETFLALPMDLHFKKPFHPSPRVSPYVAVGPAFDVLVKPEVRVFFGGSLAVGTYVWPSRRIGIDIEVDYNVVAEDRRPVHELLVAVGPVFRF